MTHRLWSKRVAGRNFWTKLGLLLLLALGACIPAPPDNDEILDYRRDTPMGLIQEAGVLRVGIEQAPPFAAVLDGSPEGFVVEYARDVAAALGVEAEFEVGSRDLLPDLVKGGEPALDMVFPMLPITEEVARHNAVTDPYWVGHQRLLVPIDSDIRTVEDLSGRKVCALRSTTPVPLVRTLSDASVSAGASRCGRLAGGGVDAVTGIDIELMKIADRMSSTGPPAYVVVGEQMSTMGFGALVRNDLPGLADFVSTQLAEAEIEGRWINWYHRWLGRWFETDPEAPPDMTAEEAAALYPAELD